LDANRPHAGVARNENPRTKLSNSVTMTYDKDWNIVP
jgi:hypothetical protein